VIAAAPPAPASAASAGNLKVDPSSTLCSAENVSSH
jgi:hypothetical protein